MDSNKLEKKAFEAIHNLKKDVALLSRCVDRVGSISLGEADSLEKSEAIKEFIEVYNSCVDRYEDSVNEKIRLFVIEVKNIIKKHKSELIAIGINEAEDGKLSVGDVQCKSKNADATPQDEEDSIFPALSEALLNAEVHMERFIPVKYLSYDSSRDYRILKNEGNIYTRGV